MATLDDEGKDRLAEAVRARRLALGFGQGDAAPEVSGTSWNLIERAKRSSYRDLTLSSVFRKLGWRHDALDFILRGEDPPVLAPPEPVPDLETRVAELELQIAELRAEREDRP